MNKADLMVMVNPASGTSTPYTTSLQHFLLSMFQGQILLFLHPRTSIRIVVHLINEAGSVCSFTFLPHHNQELSCCCNAITLALVDAGIPLKSMLASVDVAMMDDGSLLPDPTNDIVFQRKAGIGEFLLDCVLTSTRKWKTLRRRSKSKGYFIFPS